MEETQSANRLDSVVVKFLGCAPKMRLHEDSDEYLRSHRMTETENLELIGCSLEDKAQVGLLPRSLLDKYLEIHVLQVYQDHEVALPDRFQN